MSKLVFDTPHGVKISVESVQPIFLQRAYQHDVYSSSLFSPAPLLDVPAWQQQQKSSSSGRHLAGAGFGGALNSQVSAALSGGGGGEGDDDNDPILSAMGHRRRKSCGKFKQTYCAPGIKSRLKLDGVPPPLPVQAEIAQNYLPLGVAPVASSVAAAAVPAYGVGYGAVGYGAVGYGVGYGAGYGVPAYGVGYGAGLGVGVGVGAGLGCGGLAYADAALGFGFPSFRGF